MGETGVLVLQQVLLTQVAEVEVVVTILSQMVLLAVQA